MKKITILLSSLLAVLGFTGCSEDKEPVYQEPTKFVLNTPALQDQLLELTEGGSFTLICSQPDYGYSAITNYSAEVSLTPEFSDYREIASTGRGTSAVMNYRSSDLALAICQLMGLDKEEDAALVPTTPIKVYFRAVAALKDVSSSRIVSNVVSLNQVLPYFAVPQPNYIYLVGAPEGWAGPSEGNAEHYADWRLFEKNDEIGSDVYYATFDIPAGKAMFRFYTALTGWDDDSYGYQEEDNATDVEFTDNVYVHSIVKGKGSFNFPDWPGGKMDFQVDMGGMQVVITAHPDL